MPQFDTLAFFSQLFWVFLVFLTLYLVLALYVLPSISVTLKARKKLSSLDKNFDSGSNLVSKSLYAVKGEPILLQSVSMCKSVVTKKTGSSLGENIAFNSPNKVLLESTSVTSVRVSKLTSSLGWLQFSLVSSS
jgi:hypothetical protein